MKKARILLGDDHPLFAEGIQPHLKEQHEIVGIVSDGRSLVEAAVRLRPDLILLDISMPLLSGIEAARRIKAEVPRAKLLFFTMHSELSYLRGAFEAGAAGYLLKSAATPELLTAVSTVLKGQPYISSELSGHPSRLPDQGQPVKPQVLTLREDEVLNLVAKGLSSKQIAGVLNVSVKTISFHRENIKHKLGINTIAELTRFAISRELV